ncbi:MAG: GIY-YIG nuclease family protein [Candidatus Thermoplasmatota archaeon]
MKGIYFLLLKLKEPITKKVGALGDIEFKDGRYIYVGSAQKSLEGRVSRHLRSEKSKHWHIDYLLEEAEIKEVLAFEMDGKMECDSARALEKELSKIEDFGCSDCNCNSHLFFTQKSVRESIEKITANLGKEEARSKDLDLQ